MDRNTALFTKINKVLKKEFPIIESINLIDISIDSITNEISYIFVINIPKNIFIETTGMSDSAIDIITDNVTGVISDYWLKRIEYPSFNIKQIRLGIKSICKLYYNERINNFIVGVKLI